jgi:hypothetical protein
MMITKYKNIILYFVTIILCTQYVIAEQRVKNVIYVNVLPLFLGNLNVNYERAVSNNFSLMIGGSYASGLFGIQIPNWDIVSLTGKIGIGFYPAGDGLKGFYFLPNVRLGNFTVTYKPENISASITTTTLSLEIGYRWIWKGGVMFDLSIGGGYVGGGKVTVKTKTGEEQSTDFPSYIGLTHAGLQLGYAW